MMTSIVWINLKIPFDPFLIHTHLTLFELEGYVLLNWGFMLTRASDVSCLLLKIGIF